MYKKFQEQTQKPQKENNNLMAKILGIISGGGDIDDINNYVKTENINLNNHINKSILHEIIEVNDNIIDMHHKLELIKYCLNNNVYIDHTNLAKQTILHLACKAQYIDIVKLLVEKKANLIVIDQYGKTPLHYAIIGNIVDCIKKHKKKDIIPFDKDKHQYNDELEEIISIIRKKIFSLPNKEILENIQYVLNNNNDYKIIATNIDNDFKFKNDILNLINKPDENINKNKENLLNKIIEHKKKIVESLQNKFKESLQPYNENYTIPDNTNVVQYKYDILNNLATIDRKIIFNEIKKYVKKYKLAGLNDVDYLLGTNVIKILNLYINHHLNILANKFIIEILKERDIPYDIPTQNIHFLQNTPFEMLFEDNKKLYMDNDDIYIQNNLKPHDFEKYSLSINYNSTNNKTNMKCHNNNIELIKHLLQQPLIIQLINVIDNNKKTAIHYAIDNMQIDIITEFLNLPNIKKIINIPELINYELNLFKIHNDILFDDDIKIILWKKLCQSYFNKLIKTVNDNEKYKNINIKNIDNINPHFIILYNKYIYTNIQDPTVLAQYQTLFTDDYKHCQPIINRFTTNYGNTLKSSDLYTNELIHIYNLNYIYYTIDEINKNKNITAYKSDFKIIENLYKEKYDKILNNYFMKNQNKIEDNDVLKNIIKNCAKLIHNYITLHLIKIIKKYLLLYIQNQEMIDRTQIEMDIVMMKSIKENIFNESLNQMLTSSDYKLEIQIIKIIRKIYDNDKDPDKHRSSIDFIFDNIKNKLISNTILPIKEDSLFINNLEEFIFPYYRDIYYPTVINELFNLVDAYNRYIVTEYRHIQIINKLLE